MHPRTIHHPNIPQCCGNLHSEVVLKPIGNKTLPFFAFKWVPSQAKSDTFENTTTAAITLTPHQEIRYEAIVTIRILKPVFPLHVDVCNLNFCPLQQVSKQPLFFLIWFWQSAASVFASCQCHHNCNLPKTRHNNQVPSACESVSIRICPNPQSLPPVFCLHPDCGRLQAQCVRQQAAYRKLLQDFLLRLSPSNRVSFSSLLYKATLLLKQNHFMEDKFYPGVFLSHLPIHCLKNIWSYNHTFSLPYIKEPNMKLTHFLFLATICHLQFSLSSIFNLSTPSWLNRDFSLHGKIHGKYF